MWNGNSCFAHTLTFINFFVVGGSGIGVPNYVEYRNADDLYRISNVRFPEVEIVDSVTYNDFALSQTTVQFVLTKPEGKMLYGKG